MIHSQNGFEQGLRVSQRRHQDLGQSGAAQRLADTCFAAMWRGISVVRPGAHLGRDPRQRRGGADQVGFARGAERLPGREQRDRFEEVRLALRQQFAQQAADTHEGQPAPQIVVGTVFTAGVAELDGAIAHHPCRQINPGDREETCGGLMKPVSVEGTQSKYVLLYKCETCGFENKNKVSNTDDFDAVLKIARAKKPE